MQFFWMFLLLVLRILYLLFTSFWFLLNISASNRISGVYILITSTECAFIKFYTNVDLHPSVTMVIDLGLDTSNNIRDKNHTAIEVNRHYIWNIYDIWMKFNVEMGPNLTNMKLSFERCSELATDITSYYNKREKNWH